MTLPGDPAAAAILTIGHSNHSQAAFIALLRGHGVTLCADVRSAPRSRRLPHFNRERLRAELEPYGIAYAYLGRELGGRPNDPACYERGQVRYAKLARTELFQSGLAELLRRAKSERLVLLCAEREPLECHRTLLIARELEASDVGVAHIHADGHLETQHDAISRLLVELGMAEGDLFHTRAEQVEAACRLWERRIAYQEPPKAPRA